MEKKKLISFIFFALPPTLLFLACGGGGGGGDSGGGKAPQTSCANVAGTWNTTEQVNATACGEGTYTESLTYNVSQDGCNITVAPQGTNLIFNGTVNGNQISWSGSYPEEGGTTTITSLTLTLSSDGNTFSGSNSWTWSDGASRCSGTTNVSGSRTRVPLVVNKNGSGTVTSSPTGISCGTDCNESFTLGAQITLTAVAASGYTFSSWSGCDSTAGTTCVVTMNQAKTVTVNFSAQTGTQTYSLTVNKNDSGTVTSSPVGINCGTDCTEPFTQGTQVTLTAVANSGYTFSSWAGCDSSSGTSCTVVMNQAKTITASFTALPSGPSLTGPSTATVGTAFTLTWTYSFKGLASTQEGYKLEESTNSSFSSPTTVFNSINNDDRASPKSYSITKNTAGTYYYRVQAYDAPAGLTAWSNTISVTVQQPSITTKTYYSTVDATLVWSDASSTYANTNYGSTTNLGVGNYFEKGAWIDSYMKQAILVYFNTGADLTGKTIVTATLKLTPYSLAVDKNGKYRVCPVANTWNEGTATWNNAPSYYSSPSATANAPTTYTDSSWDVTSIVQEWANQTKVNYGFYIFDVNTQSSNYTWNQITFYYSGESTSESDRPKLVVQFR